MMDQVLGWRKLREATGWKRLPFFAMTHQQFCCYRRTLVASQKLDRDAMGKAEKTPILLQTFRRELRTVEYIPLKISAQIGLQSSEPRTEQDFPSSYISLLVQTEDANERVQLLLGRCSESSTAAKHTKLLKSLKVAQMNKTGRHLFPL